MKIFFSKDHEKFFPRKFAKILKFRENFDFENSRNFVKIRMTTTHGTGGTQMHTPVTLTLFKKCDIVMITITMITGQTQILYKYR